MCCLLFISRRRRRGRSFARQFWLASWRGKDRGTVRARSLARQIPRESVKRSVVGQSFSRINQSKQTKSSCLANFSTNTTNTANRTVRLAIIAMREITMTERSSRFSRERTSPTTTYRPKGRRARARRRVLSTSRSSLSLQWQVINSELDHVARKKCIINSRVAPQA